MASDAHDGGQLFTRLWLDPFIHFAHRRDKGASKAVEGRTKCPRNVTVPLSVRRGIPSPNGGMPGHVLFNGYSISAGQLLSRPSHVALSGIASSSLLPRPRMPTKALEPRHGISYELRVACAPFFKTSGPQHDRVPAAPLIPPATGATVVLDTTEYDAYVARASNDETSEGQPTHEATERKEPRSSNVCASKQQEVISRPVVEMGYATPTQSPQQTMQRAAPARAVAPAALIPHDAKPSKVVRMRTKPKSKKIIWAGHVESVDFQTTLDDYLVLVMQTMSGANKFLPAEALADNVVKRHLMLIRKMISQMRWMPSVELRRKHLNEVKKEAQAMYADSIDLPGVKLSLIEMERCLIELRVFPPPDCVVLLCLFRERALEQHTYIEIINHTEKIVQEMCRVPASKARAMLLSLKDLTPLWYNRELWDYLHELVLEAALVTSPAFSSPFWEAYRVDHHQSPASSDRKTPGQLPDLPRQSLQQESQPAASVTVNASAQETQITAAPKPAPVPAKLCRQEMRLAKRKADKEAAKNHRANPAQAPPQTGQAKQQDLIRAAQAPAAPEQQQTEHTEFDGPAKEPYAITVLQQAFTLLHCPLSSVLMTDPIVAADGVTYQRSAFKKYIGRCHASGDPYPSPIHKGALLHSLIVMPDRKMRGKVRKHQEYLRSMLSEMAIAPASKKTTKGKDPR